MLVVTTEKPEDFNGLYKEPHMDLVSVFHFVFTSAGTQASAVSTSRKKGKEEEAPGGRPELRFKG